MHSIFSYIWLYFSSLTAGECSIQLFLSTISLNSYILLVCRATPNENVCNLLIIHQQCICVYAGEIIFLFCWNKKKELHIWESNNLTDRSMFNTHYTHICIWMICMYSRRAADVKESERKKKKFFFMFSHIYSKIDIFTHLPAQLLYYSFPLFLSFSHLLSFSFFLTTPHSATTCTCSCSIIKDLPSFRSYDQYNRHTRRTFKFQFSVD